MLRKEVRDYRRNRFIVVTMAVLPCVFLALPIINIFSIPASVSSATLDTRLGLSLLYMLLIPVLVPSAWPPTPSSASASTGRSSRC